MAVNRRQVLKGLAPLLATSCSHHGPRYDSEHIHISDPSRLAQKHNIAVIVVDMQNYWLEFSDPLESRELGYQMELLHAANSYEIPIVEVKTMDRRIGEFLKNENRVDEFENAVKTVPGLDAIMQQSLDYEPFDKYFDSGFDNPNLRPYLQARDIKDLVIIGMYGSNCVHATALEAKELRFTVTVSPELMLEQTHNRTQGKIRPASEWQAEGIQYLQNHEDVVSFLATKSAMKR